MPLVAGAARQLCTVKTTIFLEDAAMPKAKQPTERHEKLQKLMSRLLAGVSARDLKKMQTQFDELESRVTAEEMNRMERLLRPVVSAKNIRKAL